MGPELSLDFAPYPPAEMAERVERSGAEKAKADAGRLLALGVLAGAFIALGAAFSTTIATGSTLGYGPTRLLVL